MSPTTWVSGWLVASNSAVTPPTSPVTAQEPTRAIAPWATLAFGLLSLAVAFGAVGLRLAKTSTGIAALRIVVSALCLPAAAIGWRTLRKTPTSDAEENNVLVAGAGLLAGVLVDLTMLLLT